MTAHTRCRRTLEPAACVACGAVEGCVHFGESESGVFEVIEFSAQSGVDAVALLSLDGKTRSHVIGFGGLLIGALVTGITLNGEPLKLRNSLAFMTVRTL